MNARESFRAAMRFEQYECLTWHEAVPDETTVRWIREGLPLEKALSEHNTELSRRGAMVSVPAKRTFDVSRYFGFSNLLSTPLELDLGPLPRFFRKTSERGENWVVRRTEHGVTERLFLDTDFFMPEFIDFPVKTRKDWEEYEKLLDPHDTRRYPKSWGDEFIEYCRNATIPIGLCFHGFFALGREVMGTVGYLLAFYDEPELVHRMLNYWADFLIEALKSAVEVLNSSIDFIFWHEDMAYNSGPFISPEMFRKFMFPCYRKLTDFFHRNGVDVIILDSDGDTRLIIPLLLEAGINGLWPLEVAAGMDAVSLRKEYGRRLILVGNIDKRIVASGDRDAIKHEVESKVGFLKEGGGYIVSLDHLVPPDTPLEAFRHYVDVLAKYL